MWWGKGEGLKVVGKGGKVKCRKRGRLWVGKGEGLRVVGKGEGLRVEKGKGKGWWGKEEG